MELDDIIKRIDEEIELLMPFGYRNAEHTLGMKTGLEIAKKIILTGDCGHDF